MRHGLDADAQGIAFLQDEARRFREVAAGGLAHANLLEGAAA